MPKKHIINCKIKYTFLTKAGHFRVICISAFKCSLFVEIKIWNLIKGQVKSALKERMSDRYLEITFSFGQYGVFCKYMYLIVCQFFHDFYFILVRLFLIFFSSYVKKITKCDHVRNYFFIDFFLLLLLFPPPFRKRWRTVFFTLLFKNVSFVLNKCHIKLNFWLKRCFCQCMFSLLLMFNIRC